jgi:hypothetical protein
MILSKEAVNPFEIHPYSWDAGEVQHLRAGPCENGPACACVPNSQRTQVSLDHSYNWSSCTVMMP